MVDSRTLTAAAGLLGGILLSVVLYLQYDTLLVLLFLPFVPVLFRRGVEAEADATTRVCPDCGFRTADPEFTHCPRDGHRLSERAGDDEK